MNNNQEFGSIRGRIFPIHQHELRKFLPMACIFLLISFCYSVTRSLKDMNIIRDASPIAISWLKMCAITPSMIIFSMFYSKVSKVACRDGRFNVVISYFLVFFIFSLYFLLPNKDALKLQSFGAEMIAKFPQYRGFWEAVACWPIALFYIHAEAWGTFALSVVFWTFVNEITEVKQAKRFYSLLSMFAAMGSICAGSTLKLESVCTNFTHGLKFVIAAIVLILIVYNYFARDIRANPSYYLVEKKTKKVKVKLSFMESLKFLTRSKYLMLLSVLVIGYGLSVSLFEIVLKEQISIYAKKMGDASILSKLYGDQQISVGIIAIIVTLCFAGPILKKGWKFAASSTPITALVMTGFFFTLLRFGSALNGLFEYFNVTALFMSVMVGIYNVVLIKSVKYVLFDPTKEAVYIPLDEETKVRGKAAVDGVGSRLGKSLGSLIIAGMSILFGGGGIQSIQVPIVLIIILVCIVWIIAVQALAKLKAEAEAKHEQETA